MGGVVWMKGEGQNLFRKVSILFLADQQVRTRWRGSGTSDAGKSCDDRGVAEVIQGPVSSDVTLELQRCSILLRRRPEWLIFA